VSDVDAYLRTYGFSVKLPGRRLIAEEGDIAIVSVDLAVEPAMNDDTILRPTLLKAVISNGRSRLQLWTMHAGRRSRDASYSRSASL
jgi:hypothetical protein